MSTKQAGERGEALAWEFLRARGCRLLARNFRAGRYEIDLIVQAGETLVFAEVKARTGRGAILGREAVTRAKQAHIIRAAEAYLQAQGAAAFDAPVRFDVLEVDLTTGGVVHFPAAFTT